MRASKSTVLRISPDLALPTEVATETLGILAKKGAGKSNAAVVLAEELHDAGVPWVAVDPKGDWWGVRSSADGKSAGLPVVVFGGKHGDVPLEPTAGALIADLVLGDDDRGYLSCVLDVSQFTISDQRRFLLDFGERLFRRKDEDRVLHLFLEEAHEYLPQSVPRESTRLVSTWQRIVKQGRFKGLGVTLVSQRSAALNKDVLTQADSLLVLRTMSPQDRAAVKGWVEVNASSGDVLQSLPQLAPGEAWLWSPEHFDNPIRFRWRRRRTFDSGATPKIGQTRIVPRTLADVDLGAVKDAMAESIEKVKADDPRELRKRIRDLEQQLADRPEPEPVIEQVPFLTHEDHVMLAELGGHMTGLHHSLGALADRFDAAVADFRAQQNSHQGRSARGEAVQRGSSAPRKPREPSRRTDHAGSPTHQGRTDERETRPASPSGPPGELNLRAGARRMVESLGRMWPLHLTTGQWGMVAHLKTTGGTWSTYLGELKRAGLVVQHTAGWQLTDAGFDYIGGRPAPMTAGELQDHYRTILRAGAVKMLDALIAAYPSGLTRDELGEQAGIVTTGGTFSTYLGELVRNGLADRVGDQVSATEILIHGAQR